MLYANQQPMQTFKKQKQATEYKPGLNTYIVCVSITTLLFKGKELKIMKVVVKNGQKIAKSKLPLKNVFFLSTKIFKLNTLTADYKFSV